MIDNTRITNSYISSLLPNQIFVFGSNERGAHGKGAAKQAIRFGAQLGKGEGLAGNSYAIPTRDGRIQTLSIYQISHYVDRFIEFAKNNTNLTFLVTEVGCGLAGYNPESIAPLFRQAVDVENIHLPRSFWRELTK